MTVARDVWGAERERVSVARDVWGAWSTWQTESAKQNRALHGMVITVAIHFCTVPENDRTIARSCNGTVMETVF